MVIYHGARYSFRRRGKEEVSPSVSEGLVGVWAVKRTESDSKEEREARKAGKKIWGES